MTDAADPNAMPDFMKPSQAYIPPTSGVFFGQFLDPPLNSPLLETLRPHRELGDWLMRQYFKSVHPVARCVHGPSLNSGYASFWDDIDSGCEPRASHQAVIFAAWFSGAVSINDEEAEIFRRQFSYDKQFVVEQMQLGTEAALSKANFLRTTRVETLQAFVMYLVS